MPNNSLTCAWIRPLNRAIALGAAACLLTAGIVAPVTGVAFDGRVRTPQVANQRQPSEGISPAKPQPRTEDGGWVRYSMPAAPIALTSKWQVVRADGDLLVIKIETYIAGELRASKEMKRSRLKVPTQYRRETISAGGGRYDCKVFQEGRMTYWYSEEVPVLGIVRSQSADNEIMELLDSSARPPK